MLCLPKNPFSATDGQRGAAGTVRVHWENGGRVVEVDGVRRFARRLQICPLKMVTVSPDGGGELCRGSFVAMMKPADLWNGDDSAGRGGLDPISRLRTDSGPRLLIDYKWSCHTLLASGT